MVGLYHKRRASRSSSNKLLRFLIRLSFILGVFIVVGFTLTALFFNGSQVKGPLSVYLSSKFNMEVSIGDAEFSPIYPDVIKLYNVKFGKSKIGELYLEYDISSALSGDEFRINDLYLDKINIEPDDLLSLATSKLGFNSIRAHTVRFYGTPLRTNFLNSPSSTVRLEQVAYSSQEGLTFRSGALSTGAAKLFGDDVKSFNIEFTHNDKGIAINNFSAGILGGTVTGYGTYNIISNDNPSSESISHHHADLNAISAEISLDELNLSKVIINQGLRAPQNVILSAKKTNLTDVIFTNNQDPLFNQKSNDLPSRLFAKDPQQEVDTKAPTLTKEGESESLYLSYIMQGINGSIEDLYIDHKSIEGMFDGHIDEISFPNLQTTFENNNTIASFANNKLEFDLKGNLYEGTFNSIGSLDLKKKRLSITELRMNKNKLALNPPRLDFLKKQFTDHSLFIKSAKFNQLEFLSFINSLPLSIQSISGTANNVFVHPTLLKDLENKISQDKEKNISQCKSPNEVDDFYKLLSYLTLDDDAIAASKEESLNLSKHKFIINPDIYSDSQETRNVIKEKSASSINLNLINMLYSNLLMSDTNVNIKLDEKALAIDIHKMRFKESSLNAQAYLALHEQLPSKLTIKAQDFETADLNSNLIGHMLTGKVNFDLNIESTCEHKINNLQSLIDHSSGTINLNSQAMLIADFGLDLINGGNSDSYKLSSTELLSAIHGSVAGINNLDTQAKITNGLFDLNSTATLVTSNLSLNSQIDLKNDQVSGRAYFISRSKDSSTQVTLSGTTTEPIFDIKALRRGEKRPGLYLPQYKTSALAKEQTDAAPVLKGKIQIIKDQNPSTQTPTPNQLQEEPLPQAPSIAATTTTNNNQAAQAQNNLNDASAQAPAPEQEQEPKAKAEQAKDETQEPSSDPKSSNEMISPMDKSKNAPAPEPATEQEQELKPEAEPAKGEAQEPNSDPKSNEMSSPADKSNDAPAPEPATEQEPKAKAEQNKGETQEPSSDPKSSNEMSSPMDKSNDAPAPEPAKEQEQEPKAEAEQNKGETQEPSSDPKSSNEMSSPMDKSKDAPAPEPATEPEQEPKAKTEQDKDEPQEPSSDPKSSNEMSSPVDKSKDAPAPEPATEQEQEPKAKAEQAKGDSQEPSPASKSSNEMSSPVDKSKDAPALEPATEQEPEAKQNKGEAQEPAKEQEQEPKAEAKGGVLDSSAGTKGSKDEINSEEKHAQDMMDEEQQALNRQKQLEEQANQTEMELLKDALINSIISKPYQDDDEEELIF